MASYPVFSTLRISCFQHSTLVLGETYHTWNTNYKVLKNKVKTMTKRCFIVQTKLINKDFILKITNTKRNGSEFTPITILRNNHSSVLYCIRFQLETIWRRKMLIFKGNLRWGKCKIHFPFFIFSFLQSIGLPRCQCVAYKGEY